MQPEQTGLAYDQITQRWLRDGFDRSNGIAQHQRALAFAKNRGKALDVGCGCTGRILDLLLNAGFTPEGVDVSALPAASASRASCLSYQATGRFSSSARSLRRMALRTTMAPSQRKGSGGK